MRILFVCHGNICRSPMAFFIFNHLAKKAGRSDFITNSAATSTEEIGNDMHEGSKKELRKNGILFTAHQAKQVKASEYDDYDIFAVMDERNLNNLKRIFGGDKENKIKRILEFCNIQRDVADPWYTGDFKTTFDDLYKACEAMIKKL